MLWTYDSLQNTYIYEVPNKCYDYCVDCALDEYDQTICDFELEHAMGVTDNELCQNPTLTEQSSGEDDGDDPTMTEQSSGEDGGDWVILAFIGGILLIITTILLVVARFFIYKMKESNGTSNDDNGFALHEFDNDNIMTIKHQ